MTDPYDLLQLAINNNRLMIDKNKTIKENAATLASWFTVAGGDTTWFLIGHFGQNLETVIADELERRLAQGE